jgi:predicted transcriptional regulator
VEKDSIKIFKCLSDKSRLLIINNLKESPMYVELLSERLRLSPSTISFHLKKLEEVKLVYSVKEQYYVVYHLNEDILSLSLNDLIKVAKSEKDIQIEREDKYKQSVLDAFFEYGKLKSIPVQQKKRKIVLEKIAESFEAGKPYTEREVNIIIADFHDDFCTIRREMIEFMILERQNNVYKLVDRKDQSIKEFDF